MVSASTDIPVCILGGLLYHKLGIKITLFIAFTMSILGSVSILTLGNTYPEFVSIMVSFAKGGGKISFDVCYLANSTLFPAIFSGTAFGICNIAAKIATILSPLVAELDPPIPMTIFTIIAAVAVLLSTMFRTAPEKIRKSGTIK